MSPVSKRNVAGSRLAAAGGDADEEAGAGDEAGDDEAGDDEAGDDEAGDAGGGGVFVQPGAASTAAHARICERTVPCVVTALA